MKLLYEKEHLACLHYDHQEKPGIVVRKGTKGRKRKVSIGMNKIAFIIKGRVRLNFKDQPAYEVVKGQIVFIPAGGDYSWELLANTMAVIFRLHQPVMLCSTFSIERLYEFDEPPKIGTLVPAGDSGKDRRIGILEIKSRLWGLLDGVIDCIGDGLKCRYWYELKIKEILLMFRIYYTKEELCDFFYLILSGNTAFSEYVRLHWKTFSTIADLAASMSMTHKQFSKRFVAIFKQTPHRWISERKADMAFEDIIATRKSFKEIAYEHGFRTDTQFSRFCKKYFGKSPTELRQNKA